MTPISAIALQPALIMIVDDDAASLEVLELILTREGFRLTTATNGTDARAAWSRQAPDLILLDVMLPDVSGYELLAELKGSLVTRHIPVIMITAFNDYATKQRALGAGAERFLSKPMDLADLRAQVRKCLHLPPLAPLAQARNNWQA